MASKKTHCKHGHEFTPENTRVRPDGTRSCITCVRKANGIQTTILPATTKPYVTNYKEPLRKFDGGFGYAGTIATNEAQTHIQCHICGNFYESLGNHIRSHDLTADEYREKVGLSRSTSLIGKRRREILVAQGLEKSEQSAAFMHRLHYEVREGLRDPETYIRKSKKRSLEQLNKEGLCPDQLLDKIKVLELQLGTTPTLDQFSTHYKVNPYIIYNTFGSWMNALKLLGMQSRLGRNSHHHHSNEQLLEYLRQFYETNGRPPTASDFSRGILPSLGLYSKRFRTLRIARSLAGIPNLKIVGPGQFVEQL